jgi:glycosyltransferase involved in cell wall biosynthesis
MCSTDYSKKSSLVTIGMPVYNDERFICKALDSLLAQTFTDFELIISDNASTDRTEAICREYVARDIRLHYIRRSKNYGQAANFNFLLQQARCEYFMWAASDDCWDHEFISTLLNELHANPRCVSAFCPYVCIDSQDQIISNNQVVNCSSRRVLERLYKFCLDYNDAPFYGLHRRQLISEVRFPTWWGMNKSNPYNGAFPVLFHIFSVGDIVIVDSSPLWFNRIHSDPLLRPSYVHLKKNLLTTYTAFLLRKVNLLYASVRSVYEGTHSVFIVLAVMPALIIRFGYDCTWQTITSVFSNVRHLLSMLRKN